MARDFHRVFHGFGAAVHQHGAFIELTGGEFVEFFCQCNVGLIRRDHKRGVGEPGGSVLDGLDDARVGGTGGGHGDAGGQV